MENHTPIHTHAGSRPRPHPKKCTVTVCWMSEYLNEGKRGREWLNIKGAAELTAAFPGLFQAWRLDGSHHCTRNAFFRNS